MHLYEPQTGEELHVTGPIDITEACRNISDGSKVFLYFAQTKRGRLCVIRRTYARSSIGVSISLFVDDLGAQPAKAELLDPWARRLGFKPEEFCALIREKASIQRR